VADQRGHLRPAVAVPVQVRDGAHGLLPHGEPVAAQDARGIGGGDAREQGPIREHGVVVPVRLDDADLCALPPQPRRAVDGARDDRQDEHHQPHAEPRRAEHVEQLEAIESAHHARSQHRVVERVELVHLVRVVGGRAEGEARQLAQDHADDGEQREHDDLEDREVNRRQQAPGAVGDP
jgi:hypothetical protein